MCTVSYIKHNNKCFITSNRDEHISRPVALYPNETKINGYKVIYPKDPKGEGTWFAMREDGVALVLLNGAFKKHVIKQNYGMSRGLILLKIIRESNPLDEIRKIDLDKIEPFTLILFIEGVLVEFRWDGNIKYKKELDANDNHIWSSVTLYDEDIREIRRHLFNEFLKNHKEPNEGSIIDFHSNNNNDFENGFIIHRGSGLHTVSITQANIKENTIDVTHLDLVNNPKKSRVLTLTKSVKMI